MSENKSKRRYHLRNKHDESERIVLANSRAQALTHVAVTDWDVEVLDTENAIRLTREGVTEELAGATDPDQQPLALGDSTTAVGGTD